MNTMLLKQQDNSILRDALEFYARADVIAFAHAPIIDDNGPLLGILRVDVKRKRHRGKIVAHTIG